MIDVKACLVALAVVLIPSMSFAQDEPVDVLARHRQVQWELVQLQAAIDSEVRDDSWALTYEAIFEKTFAVDGVTISENRCGTTLCYVDLRVLGDPLVLNGPLESLNPVLFLEGGGSGNIQKSSVWKQEGDTSARLRMFVTRRGYKLPDVGEPPADFVTPEKLETH